MKIYDFKGFPNPARIRIAVAEKGLADQIEFVAVNVPEGEHKTPSFTAKNPAAAVPVLELEDGTCIAECTAITEYLDHMSGAPTLTGARARERAVIHMMQRRTEATLLDAVATYFHHATPGLGPSHRDVPEQGVGREEPRARARRHAISRPRPRSTDLRGRRPLHHGRHHGLCRSSLCRHCRDRHCARADQPHMLACQHRRPSVRSVDVSGEPRKWISIPISASAP